MIKKNIILIIIVLTVVGGTGWFIYKDFSKTKIDEESLEKMGGLQNNTPGEAIEGQIGIEYDEFEGDAAVEIEKVEVPDLDKAINKPENMQESVFNQTKESIEYISTELKKNPDLFSYWIDLGIYRKTIDDYEGAKEAWEYASLIRPSNTLSFGNLGGLYAYYLKDYSKAEENYLQSVENDHTNLAVYYNLYEFYRYLLKDQARAKEILEEAIEFNPGTSQDLQSLLESF